MTLNSQMAAEIHPLMECREIIRCHICGEDSLELIEGFDSLPLVSSDCKVFCGRTKLYWCAQCGMVQKAADDRWKRESEEIYRSYAIYHQSGGKEQMVFERNTGLTRPRSDQLVSFIAQNIALPSEGRLLDIGCGNGAFLKAFSRFSSNWLLAGTEFNEEHRQELQSIPGFQRLYTDPLPAIGEKYDLITLVHVLEHIPQPVNFLLQCKDRLEEGGYIVIESPDFVQNPFDLVIVDHCTHFTPLTLETVIMNSTLDTMCLTTQCIPKEVTFVGRNNSAHPASPQITQFHFEQVKNSVNWLRALSERAKELSKKHPFGLFGTSIAATWLHSILGNHVDFFVEEDPYRIGKTYLGIPVYHPSQLDGESGIFVPLSPLLAEEVKTRLENTYGLNCHISAKLL